MRKNPEDIINAVRQEDWARGLHVQEDFWTRLTEWIFQDVVPEFVTRTIRHVDEIVQIDPDLSEPKILAMVTGHMVDYLDARSASVRIYDPNTGQMLSYGSYPSEDGARETYIPLEGSIAGVVVKTRRPYMVPNIQEDPLYLNKKGIERKGSNSMLAIPVEIPRFSPLERDTVGVIQIYYPEKDRRFTPLEVQVAELMSRRLSFVIARKKIMSLSRVNEKKETIVRHIFRKLGTGGGVKMKEVFNRVIPELVDIINLQSCALFSVSDDLESIVLEAGYPDSVGHHGIGKRLSIHSEPAFEIVVNVREYPQESPYEMVTHSHLLIMDPQKSSLISDSLKHFALSHNINSILYVPLNVGEEITHFMTFDAVDQRQRYSAEEIEIFIFLGRELIKAQRMERLDDILHDFKNPAIATAGFARRLKDLLQVDPPNLEDPRIKKYVEILLEESSRLQEMALSTSQGGKEQLISLTDVLKRRFEINKEVIKEQLKQNVTIEEGPFEDPLYVRCFPLHLERVMDNLLNNATNALPLHGGTLSIRTYADGAWACAEITNTGMMSEEERVLFMDGEGRGRGLYITHRIIRILNGRLEIRPGQSTTTMVVCLPLSATS